MRKQKGFSLIELLIVVAIILIIAAIAIPNLLKSKIAANEASAVGSTRTLVTTEITYSTSHATFTDLATLGTEKLIDATLATGAKSGYTFTTDEHTATSFVVNAVPQTAGTSGVRCFCGAADGTVHQAASGCSAVTTGDACIALTPL